MATQYIKMPVQSQGSYHQSQHENFASLGKGYHASTPPNVHGFAFRQRFERLDWRKIAAIDIDQISRTLDFQALQENIMNITFCNLESELDFRMSDPNFLKIFKLAQLTIEYLLHSQDYLTGMVSSLEETVKNLQQENEDSKKTVEQSSAELSDAKKESHRRKKLLVAQQQLIHAGSGSYQKCPFCPKAFLSSQFLQAHVQRRHSDMHGSQSQPSSESAGVVNNQSLETELREIRDRLRLTESLLHEERKLAKSVTEKENVEDTSVEHRKQLEAWKEELAADQKQDVENMTSVFMKELKEMNEKFQASEEARIELERMYGIKKSNLGQLQDDVDVEREVSILREQLQGVEQSMDIKLERQEKKWKRKMKELNDKHLQEVSQLNVTLDEKVRVADRAPQETAKEVPQKYKEQSNSRKKREEPSSSARMQEQPPVSREPPQVTPRRTPSPVQAKPAQRLMYEDLSDEEDDSELESQVTSGKSTLRSTMHSSLGSTSQSLMGSMHTRVQDKLLIEPNFLRPIRETMEDLLEEKLERWGIPPNISMDVEKTAARLQSLVIDVKYSHNAKGIPDEVYQSKLASIHIERKALAKKITNYYVIRNTLDKAIDEEAKRKYKDQKRTPPLPSGRRTASSGVYGSSQSLLSANTTASSFQRSPITVKKSSPPKQQRTPAQSHTKPQPNPRTSSRSPQRTTLDSTGSTYTSTQWSSDEDYDSDDVSDEEPLARPAAPTPPRASPVPRPRGATPPQTSKAVTTTDDSDWDSETDSEFEEPARNKTAAAAPRQIMSTPKPKGERVSSLTKSIEMQLSGRKPDKPFAGVDLMKSGEQKKNFDEDSFGTVSSVEEDEQLVKPAIKGGVRRSHGDTDYSSNTYGTSQWGSSSRAASTVNPGTHNSGAGKSSVMNITDIDDEFNISDY